MNNTKKYHVWIIVGISNIFLICILSVIANSIKTSNSWITKNIANRTEQYCENIHWDRFIREPYNSYTSILFIISAIIPAVFCVYDLFELKSEPKANPQKEFIPKNPFFSAIISLIYTFHAIGTFVNHACACQLGLALDNMFMWSSLILILWLGFVVNFHTKIKNLKSIYLSFILGYGIIAALMGIISFSSISNLGRMIISSSLFLSITVFNVIFITSRIRKGEQRRKSAFFWAALFGLILGLFFAVIDLKWCFGSIGFHSGWHLLATISLVLMYFHQRRY